MTLPLISGIPAESAGLRGRPAHAALQRTVRWAALWLAAAAVGWTAPASSQPATQMQMQDLRDRVNAFRAEAGLPPLHLDHSLSQGCMAHARYMVLNHGTAAMGHLNPHQHRQGLPGSSSLPDAAACARQSVLSPKVASLQTALENWMGGLYHRRPILSPAVTRMGVGIATHPDGSIAAALMLPEEKHGAAGWPVLWPADGQTDVPLEFAVGEVPSPIPGPVRTGGYPVTLYFEGQEAARIVSASLLANNRNVPVHLSSPADPVTPFSRYGVVSMIPKEPLLPATDYRVAITTELKGRQQTVQSSFRTVGLLEVAADDLQAMQAAIGQPSRISGVIRHGGTMQGRDGPVVFLQFKVGDGSPLVSVLVPEAVWRRLGENGGEPSAWRGYELQVDATPRRVGNKAINLPISSTRQFMTGAAR